MFVDPRFANEEFYRWMIKYVMQQDEFQKRAFEVDGKYHGRYRRSNLIVPLGMRQYFGESKELSWFGPSMFFWALKNAEHLRRTLIDESIPLHDRNGIYSLNGRTWLFGLFDCCRQNNVIALWYLRYWPALPELREAMLHERDQYMRSQCVQTIGVMGERGLAYAKDIRDSIEKFGEEPFYLGYAATALAELGDTDSTLIVRELFENARARIDRLTFGEAMKQVRGWIYLIDDITQALIKLDPEMARDVLAMELVDPNSHVSHFARSAFKLSPLRHYAKLIESSMTNAVASLPKDPGWVFSRILPRFTSQKKEVII